MNKTITVSLAVAVILVAGILYFKSHPSEDSMVMTPTPSLGVVASVSFSTVSPTATPKVTKSVSPTPGLIAHEVKIFNVAVQNMAYSPASVTVQRGDVVVFTNGDVVLHTVTSDTGAFDSGHLDPSGQWQLATANMQPGTYAYHCTFHANMHGTIIIQ